MPYAQTPGSASPEATVDLVDSPGPTDPTAKSESSGGANVHGGRRALSLSAAKFR